MQVTTRSPHTVHPASFRETSGLNEAAYHPYDGYSEALWSGTSEQLVAPVDLPDGAEIVYWTAWLYDDTAADIAVNLRRKHNAGSSQVLATIPSSGSAGNQVWIDGIPAGSPIVVDNGAEQYSVDWCLPAGYDGSRFKLYAVQIGYQESP